MHTGATWARDAPAFKYSCKTKTIYFASLSCQKATASWSPASTSWTERTTTTDWRTRPSPMRSRRRPRRARRNPGRNHREGIKLAVVEGRVDQIRWVRDLVLDHKKKGTPTHWTLQNMMLETHVTNSLTRCTMDPSCRNYQPRKYICRRCFRFGMESQRRTR